jgi:hypothetical protein
MGFNERLFLLQMLAKYMRQSSVKRAWSFHFEAGNLRSLMEKMESLLFDESISFNEVDVLLKETAANESLCFFHISGDFAIVSMDNLYTTWGKADLEIKVLRRKMDGKILIMYPKENGESVEWEGNKPEDDYHVIMSVDKGDKFNGRNGILQDTDREEIKCFCKRKCPTMTDTPGLTTIKKQKSRHAGTGG